jgi:hypothetical protein
MDEPQTPEHKIDGRSVRNAPRILSLMDAEPGAVAVTIYVGKKPNTVVVPVAKLQAALDKIGK